MSDSLVMQSAVGKDRADRLGADIAVHTIEELLIGYPSQQGLPVARDEKKKSRPLHTCLHAGPPRSPSAALTPHSKRRSGVDLAKSGSRPATGQW